MRKFLLLLLGVTFLCVNNSNAQNNNPQGGQQQIEFRILKGGHHSSGTSGEHHAPYMQLVKIMQQGSCQADQKYILIHSFQVVNTCISGQEAYMKKMPLA